MSDSALIDLRSDTITHPTDVMRQAMAHAEVGDDVFGEDPTVNRLEQTLAACTGQEAGLFVASGTMGNLVAVLTHCGRGDEVILGDQSHTYIYEAGGSAALGSVHSRVVPNQPDGTLDLSALEAAVRPDDVHFPRSRLICLENTHNRCGGRVLSPDYTRQVSDLAHRHQLKLHVDGARIFNAARALGVDVQDLTAPADSVSVCLSKGLAAPVGSVLCGSGSFIAEARRVRKSVGGGMRQAGILAAAGLVAVEHMTERLGEDHAHAQQLAQGLTQLPGITLDPATVQTNIVFFDLVHRSLTPAQWAERLAGKGVRILALGPTRLRAVTHCGITARQIKQALSIMQQSL